MATNFDVLYQFDTWALVDLLTCYREDRSCEDCRFAKYGCPDGPLHDEDATLSWLAREARLMRHHWKAVGYWMKQGVAVYDVYECQRCGKRMELQVEPAMDGAVGTLPLFGCPGHKCVGVSTDGIMTPQQVTSQEAVDEPEIPDADNGNLHSPGHRADNDDAPGLLQVGVVPVLPGHHEHCNLHHDGRG